MKRILTKDSYRNLLKIILINLNIFIIVNLLFKIKYEQVDDFIIYRLYSGLDGTFSMYGVYMHTVLCATLGVLYRIIPVVNWHSIFLLSMQFISFTAIGYCMIEKHKSEISVMLYTIFAGLLYTISLIQLQYTCVAALLMTAALVIIIHLAENENKSIKLKILAFTLFAIGIMVRIQSALIVAPFFGIYAIYYLIKFFKKTLSKEALNSVVKDYIIIFLITVAVYISHNAIYQSNPVYKEYTEYNKLRTILQDNSYTDYETNKVIFDEIGWSKNDHYIFYTFNFGDEKVYSKENLQKIIDYKISTNQYYQLQLNVQEICKNLYDQLKYSLTPIAILMIVSFLVAMIKTDKKRILNIAILLASLALNILFIILQRNILRVVIPGYITGIALLIYNINWKEKKQIRNSGIIIVILIIAMIFSARKYNYNYNRNDYTQYKDIITYTNEHKENMYLYTVPSLQNRYLAYSVYEMPPKGAFSNLRVMGGWDMFTQNYYNNKERANLEGTFLDLLKENVYLIDGHVMWGDIEYSSYINNIMLFIKEHYNIDATYEKVEEFNNLYIYKVKEEKEKNNENFNGE